MKSSGFNFEVRVRFAPLLEELFPLGLFYPIGTWKTLYICFKQSISDFPHSLSCSLYLKIILFAIIDNPNREIGIPASVRSILIDS